MPCFFALVFRDAMCKWNLTPLDPLGQESKFDGVINVHSSLSFTGVTFTVQTALLTLYNWESVQLLVGSVR